MLYIYFPRNLGRIAMNGLKARNQKIGFHKQEDGDIGDKMLEILPGNVCRCRILDHAWGPTILGTRAQACHSLVNKIIKGSSYMTSSHVD